uniref:Spc7 kinetochore protein domain-containing protein n=1 Tax=Schizophyllum commune (strain H4-8 / FGSC 9210) TaxID=578458 RepID=D8PL34_SCHCM
MGVREESSKRRKSIAGTSSRSSLGNKGRRRAYSIAPGSALSPLAKARRDLVPRKSILKVPVAILHGDDPSFTPSPDTSETRDFTNDFNRRKSLGRRVSFSSTAHIRYFKKQPRPSDAASSETGSMDGSPERAPPPPPPRPTNDENAYPGSTSNRRRSSVGRPSMAPSDMDVTGVFDFAQQPQGNGGSALDDSEDSYVEDGDDGDMDVTQSMPNNLARRKSSVAFQDPADASDASNMSVDPDQTGSYMDESTMQSDTEPLECEVPLGQALNPPVSNDAWDALEQAANENVSPGNDEDDDLEDAIQRLRRASAFLPQTSGEISEDSFASTEDSFNPDGEETMNISRALGRVSMGGNTNLARMSMGGESAMDESGVYGRVGVEPELPATQSPPNSQPQQPASAPPQQQQQQTQTLAASTTQTFNASTTQPLAISSNKPPVFRPPPLNSITGTPKPGFSAAFAPPTVKPSPRKFGQQQQESAMVPEKRARNENEAGKRPLGEKGASQNAAQSGAHVSPQGGSSKTSPQALANSTAGPAGPSTSPQPRPLSPSRIPSAAGTGSPPRKKASIGMGRASMGVAGSERMPSTHRRTSLQPPVPVLENGKGKGKGRAVVQEPGHEDEHVGEDMEVDEDERDKEEAGDGQVQPSGGEAGVDTQRMQAWVDGVDQENPEEPEEVPQVSIQEFFEITGIKFIDEMIAPRRSIAPRQARPADSIPLSEYLVALAVDLPQLDLYGRVADDLARSNTKYKENFEEMEREAALDTPELFQEYMLAEPEDQEGFRHYLTLIKANARMQAKSAWYSWKSTWVEELTGIAQSELEAMEADTKTIAELNAQLETALPELERQHAEVTAQLEKERTEIAEVEACNQDWLNELKGTIADQSTEIRSFETELAQVRSGKQHVQARIDEYEAEKQEHMAAIANANRMLDVRERRTHSEVRRLQAELDALEDLHQFRMRTIRPDLFEYEFLEKYLVSLPCRAFQPVNQGINITYLPGRPIVRDDFPKYTALVLQTAKRRIAEGPKRTIPKIVQELRDYFFSCKELRSQLGLITVKYPVELSVLHDQGEALMATAIVLFKPVKAKAFVSFIFADEVFATWPHSIKGVRVKVDVAYGQIDPELLSMAVTSRLAEATLQDNYACLLDACIQAQEQYPAADSTAMET